MAAIPVTLIGQATTDASGQTTFVGLMAYSDRGVGGGPIIPPDAPGTWPPQRPPHPAHPIVTPPPSGGGGGGDAHPEHPIVLPPDVPPPTGEADEDGFIKPPPAEGGWGYHEDHGWLYKPGAGQAGPK